MDTVIQLSYFVAAVLFILGLKRMSSPKGARGGILWAGVGMVVATLATFFHPEIYVREPFAQGYAFHNLDLILIAIAIGGVLAWWSGKRVAMTDMPQMIALYNGMGGGAAAAIAAVELFKGGTHELAFMVLAVLGGLIGAVSFSGSLVAFSKLQGIMKKTFALPAHQVFNLLLFSATLAVGAWLVFGEPGLFGVALFFLLALAVGVLMTLPIGGADMPVVISLYNALTGLAVGFEGFVLNNPAMIIAGTVVGAAGTLLTQLMAKAMNRSLANVLFKSFGPGDGGEGSGPEGEMKPIEAQDAAILMAYSNKVIIVPGFGMAVAQAQHKIWELTQLLEKKGVEVKFAIHPVAGRMPGHMNVLLAEAGVPYDKIFDLEEINNEFPNADCALVIGANDVVNPAARNNPDSPIYGMPILDADRAQNVIVMKRGQGRGFSGIENELFFADNARMLYGDGQAMAAELVGHLKTL
ncbi:MAG: NAD(P)(+) transhydrogenase (Re/Si-specific) subunit beta [Chromatiales bacterium]|nr:NAD(P)(+) transhydrogenase (Re/Si-specific) subunit beta [Chromatiales bacterium]